MRAELPLLLGVVPFGLIFGVLGLAAGLPGWAVVLSSSLIFGGSSQVVFAQLWGAATPPPVMVTTVGVVNLRHLLYSAAVADYLRDLPWRWEALLAYLLSDEAFAAAIGRLRDGPATAHRHFFLLGTGFTLWAGWQLSTLGGVLLGAAIPASWSLEFSIALTINPLLVQAYLSNNYVIQQAWTQTLEARVGGDATQLLADTAEDVVYSGPYHKFFADDTKVVYVRDDNYWGQDASMWGKLPAPKYLAHTIFKDNAAGFVALQVGQVDVSQQFNANIQDLWLKNLLPISTYMPEAPYGIGASLPTAFYNPNSYGLDQVAVRKAIAIAVDYPTIIANAMTNQSATFDQVPRSLMNPTPGEQAMYDQAAVKDLQWTGNDIEGAKKLLDDAGIVDTDGDGWREYNGQKLSYVATCPNGWSDWQAAIEVVAAAGKEIGIDITTNYPEWAVYQTVVTKSDAPLAEGYDIFMMWSDGAGPTQPWGRIRKLMSSEFIGMASNWNGNWGGYSNPDADALIQAIPTESDPAKLKEMYTELVKIYLTDVPSFTLMYRPQSFHAVNETVWTNFPNEEDGTNPPVPPLDLTDGWSIAGLYNLTLVNK